MQQQPPRNRFQQSDWLENMSGITFPTSHQKQLSLEVYFAVCPWGTEDVACCEIAEQLYHHFFHHHQENKSDSTLEEKEEFIISSSKNVEAMASSSILQDQFLSKLVHYPFDTAPRKAMSILMSSQKIFSLFFPQSEGDETTKKKKKTEGDEKVCVDEANDEVFQKELSGKKRKEEEGKTAVSNVVEKPLMEFLGTVGFCAPAVHHHIPSAESNTLEIHEGINKESEITSQSSSRRKCTVENSSAKRISHEQFFQSLLQLRSVETICAYVTTCSFEDIEKDEKPVLAISASKSRIEEIVFSEMFPLRAVVPWRKDLQSKFCSENVYDDHPSCGQVAKGKDASTKEEISKQELAPEENLSATTTCTTEILFRVTTIRRPDVEGQKKKKFNSQEISARVGEIIGELFPTWRVSLMYFNVEFLVIHDHDNILLGIVMHAPNLPRLNGSSIEKLFEIKNRREEILQKVRQGIVTNDDAKTLVGRPAHFRNDIRISKGDNSMHPALAHALCRYAEIEDGDAVLDPVVGSGTLLMEALIALSQRIQEQEKDEENDGASKKPPVKKNGSLVLLGGDLESSEVKICHQNLSDSERLELDWRCFCDSGKGIEDCKKKKGLLSGASTSLLLPKYIFSALQWDATQLPLRSGSMDVVLSDLPFGKRCGSHKTNVRTYPQILRECIRVLSSKKPLLSTKNPQQKVIPSEEAAKETVCEEETSHLAPQKKKRKRIVLLSCEKQLMQNLIATDEFMDVVECVVPPFQLDMHGLSPTLFVLQLRE